MMTLCALCLFQINTAQMFAQPADNTTNTSITAFTATFVRRDGAVIQSVKASAVQWVFNLMDKQDIPKNASGLRNLTDAQLLSIGMKAAVSGISQWRREAISDRIIVNDNTG